MAGHGAEHDGKHYLIPQDFPVDPKTNAWDPKKLRRNAIEQQQVLEDIAAKTPLVTLAILDCCREIAETRAGFSGAPSSPPLPSARPVALPDTIFLSPSELSSLEDL